MASPLTTSSTRRLRWRPSAVSLEATGCILPKPRAGMEGAGTPCSAGKWRAGLAGVGGGVEEHVGHVDDEAAGGVAGLQNGIELIEELGAHLSFFGFGLRGGLARFFGFGFGGALLSDGGGPVSCGLVSGGL